MNFLELDFDSQVTMYAQCHGNPMSIAEHCNISNVNAMRVMKKQGLTIPESFNSFIDWRDVKATIDSYTPEQKKICDEAYLIYLDRCAKKTFEQSGNPTFQWKFLTTKHPDYREKDSGPRKLVINFATIERAGTITGKPLDQLAEIMIGEKGADEGTE